LNPQARHAPFRATPAIERVSYHLRRERAARREPPVLRHKY
jgi:hypothetical protein